MRHIEFHVERIATQVVVRITDDGPGLPKRVTKSLQGRFAGRLLPAATAMALRSRAELAERNGGTLELTSADAGTTFTLALAALPLRSVKEGPVDALARAAGGEEAEHCRGQRVAGSTRRLS